MTPRFLLQVTTVLTGSGTVFNTMSASMSSAIFADTLLLLASMVSIEKVSLVATFTPLEIVFWTVFTSVPNTIIAATLLLLTSVLIQKVSRKTLCAFCPTIERTGRTTCSSTHFDSIFGATTDIYIAKAVRVVVFVITRIAMQ